MIVKCFRTLGATLATIEPLCVGIADRHEFHSGEVRQFSDNRATLFAQSDQPQFHGFRKNRSRGQDIGKDTQRSHATCSSEKLTSLKIHVQVSSPINGYSRGARTRVGQNNWKTAFAPCGIPLGWVTKEC
ncbi:MAG: hypothetical protein ACK56F_28085, partial [bacterium]